MLSPMGNAVVNTRNAREMQQAAAEFLKARVNQEVIVVGHSLAVAGDVVREALGQGTAVFGWQRTTFLKFASHLALPRLAVQGKAPAGGLPLRALCARVVHQNKEELGRFKTVGDRPGFSVALADSFSELSAAGVTAESLLHADADLARLYGAYRQELSACGMVDKGQALVEATQAAIELSVDGLFLGRPIVFLDVQLRSKRERDFVAAVVKRAPACLVAISNADLLSTKLYCEALGCESKQYEPSSRVSPSLDAVRERTFNPDCKLTVEETSCVRLFSAPGEHRESVEIVRRIQRSASEGIPFDRMAVLLRNPNHHIGALQEAFFRGQVPVHFARATVRPDPHGRALLALIACKREGLSARAFSEYLSLSVVPADVDGAPPPANDDFWIPPDDESLGYHDALSDDDAYEDSLLPDWEAQRFDEEAAASVAGALRAPRRWEKLIVSASVIGGYDRWVARLSGLEASLRLELSSADETSRRASAPRELEDLAALREFALPLIKALEELPKTATWGEWIKALTGLATRALSQPTRVVECLAELSPMAPIGPVSLAEVELVLSRRLTELRFREGSDSSGKVWVSSIEEARGRSFDTVFLPGLAEKMFPEKVMEDPILLDHTRAAVDPELPTNVTRIAEERMLLRLGQYAAERQLFLSWPSVHTDRGRPRVASFYALEVARALTGDLPTFEHLAQIAERDGKSESQQLYRSSLRWPAPRNPQDAIDEVEFDLSVLRDYMIDRAEAETGAARYLMDVNAHLARSLRARTLRWSTKQFTKSDGLVGPSMAAVEWVHNHALKDRAYSATALQRYASCPYQFFIMSLLSLSPRDVAVAIDELDPLQRGQLIHDVQFALLTELKKQDLLPIASNEALGQATVTLDSVLETVSERHREELAPAILRVWQDGIAAIRADLREWLYRMHQDGSGWVPSHFELAFGLKKHLGHADAMQRDAASIDEPVTLECGIQLRGAIDMVETGSDDALRAVDQKTGKASAPRDLVINGGKTLQPLLYALALEKLFPDRRVLAGGLHYSTRRGDYETRWVPLDPVARQAAETLTTSIEEALSRAFFPAYPIPERKVWGKNAIGGCAYCDVKAICGPHEAERTRQKDKRWLKQLNVLRKHQ